MNKKEQASWMKHFDFVLLDIVALQLCFVAAYWILHGFSNPYEKTAYRYLAIVLFVAQIIVLLFFDNYHLILLRKRFEEFQNIIKTTIFILVIALLYLFAVQQTQVVSRLQTGLTCVLFLLVDYAFRAINKLWINHRNKSGDHAGKHSIALITTPELIHEVLEKLFNSSSYHDYFLSYIVLFETSEPVPERIEGIRALAYGEAAIQALCHGWIDDVLLVQPDSTVFPKDIINNLLSMGITLHYTISSLSSETWLATDVGTIGPYLVLTSGMRFIPAGQLIIKRAMDIMGGIVGCILTGIIFLFIAPIIYISDPGPIFFTQKRVGKNGKFFKIYKFRSMYMDAEARKASLMEKNQLDTDLMFKIEDDPRIIGSEKKDKNGKPKGIGNFIRKTSLDEFPQFLNVLLGQMSLVGTRPPTVDEWNKYEPSHRIRMNTKPGITGMWQVSGRSAITDFDEVVRLDRDYIENWSLLLDIKIILKTIIVVFTRSGAK